MHLDGNVQTLVPPVPLSHLEPNRPSRMRRIELRTLEVFVTVADTGNMTVTAKKLGMTQPAVSQVVRQLEKDIGSSLLDRELRPLRLTPSGVVLIKRARQLLTDADRLCAEVHFTENAQLPRLRVGFVDSFAITVGPNIATSLKQDVEQLIVRSAVTQELRSALICRDLDIIISSDSLEDVPDLERRRLLREPYVLIVPNEPKRRWDSMSLADLATALPLIRLSTRSVMGVQVDRHLGWLRIEAPRGTEFDSVEVVAATVAKGGGWAIVPPLSLARAAASLPHLRLLPLPGPSLARSLYLVSRSGEFDSIAESLALRCSPMLRAELTSKFEHVAPWILDLVQIN